MMVRMSQIMRAGLLYSSTVPKSFGIKTHLLFVFRGITEERKVTFNEFY